MKPARPLDPSLTRRFAAALDSLIAPDARLGLAVSGGADSLAMLLLTAAVRPGKIEAATVDHGLRAASAGEASFVASICHEMSIRHAILHADWEQPPETALQERARQARYRALGRWAEARGLAAILVAHHADDQAETFLMRLSRGAGVRGLACMRAASKLPGHPSIPLVRPLLDWRRPELETICFDAGLNPVCDPSNIDERFERVRVRGALAAADWLDPDAIARSAANLALADQALEWATKVARDSAVERNGATITYRPSEPVEIRRRIVAALIGELATEGTMDLRGRELDQLLATLDAGGTATLRGVRCSGENPWTFCVAAPRSQ